MFNSREFLEEYRKKHAVCPKCGSKNYSTTLAGYLVTEETAKTYKDKNSIQCFNCGFTGIRHDLVPETRGNIFVIIGYKPATEAFGPQDSDILGYCENENDCKELLEKFKEKYIPQFFDSSWYSMITWKYKGKIEDYINSDEAKEKNISPENIIKDYNKFKNRVYSYIGYEEVKFLTEVPECKYTRGGKPLL